MTKTIEYTQDDNTAALRALKSGVNAYGERIPRAMRDRAIRILHRMPAAGELEYDFTHSREWNATLHAQCAIAIAVQDRKYDERKAAEPKTRRSSQGPAALRAMFDFSKL